MVVKKRKGEQRRELTLIAMRLACDFCARFPAALHFICTTLAFEFDLINFMLIEKRC